MKTNFSLFSTSWEKSSKWRCKSFTNFSLQALQGHLSLIHVNYAKDSAVMQTGETVGEWRSKLKTILYRNEFDGDHPNKYSGYVYDAVWLYALALDKLIKQNKSYIQDIHR